MRSGSAEKTYASGQRGGVGGPGRVGVGGDTRDDGGVQIIVGVAVGDGGANGGSSAGEGGANGESCAGEV